MGYTPLKYWFNQELCLHLATKISSSYPPFEGVAFTKRVNEQLGPLELMQRIELIADELANFLPATYSKALGILLENLGPENQEETGMFKRYYWILPIAKFIEKYGLKMPELSLNALEEITKRSTAEYAIRPFITAHRELTLARMLAWSQHENFHLRRLASEGGRPRLPWSKKLDAFIADPRPLLPILEQLKDDPSRYVQKSVANCINDILKDNEIIGKSILTNWAIRPSSARIWIIKHGLRNKVKAEEPWAKTLFHSLSKTSVSPPFED